MSAYEAARTHAAVFRREDRALVRLYGRDPLRMLQGLLTNDLANAPAERAVPAALLTPKGRMVAAVRAWKGKDRAFLETATKSLPGLLDYLKKYVPPLFAKFEHVADARVLGVYGPRAHDVVAAVLGDVDVDAPEHGLWFDGEVARLRTRYTGDDGWDMIAAADVIDALEHRIRDAGVEPGDAATLDLLRIEAGSPRWGAELTEEVIPLEAGLMSWISTTKGCYTGQEVIVRILHRGHVNRHLRGFLLDSVVAAGTEILNPETGRAAGVLTSVCDSPWQGRPIALGYARRELEPPVEVPLSGDAGHATVVSLPFDRAS